MNIGRVPVLRNTVPHQIHIGAETRSQNRGRADIDSARSLHAIHRRIRGLRRLRINLVRLIRHRGRGKQSRTCFARRKLFRLIELVRNGDGVFRLAL